MFREPPKSDLIDPWDYRLQVGSYDDDAIKPRMTPKLAGMREKQLLANEPIYAAVMEPGDRWRIRDHHNHEVHTNHIISDPEYHTKEFREILGNGLIAQYQYRQAETTAKLKREMSIYRIERRQWELDLVSREWNAGNRQIFRNDFPATNLEEARAFVAQENARDLAGEIDETITGQPIPQTQRQEATRKRRRIDRTGDEHCIDDDLAGTEDLDAPASKAALLRISYRPKWQAICAITLVICSDPLHFEKESIGYNLQRNACIARARHGEANCGHSPRCRTELIGVDF